MSMEPEALIKRAQTAERKRDAFASLMRECYRYAMPERDAWSSYGYGQERISEVYDSTAMLSTARFATRLCNALFPPRQRWAELTLPEDIEETDETQNLREQMEGLTEILFKHISESNFDSCMHEAAHDLAAGVSAILIENGRLASGRSHGPLLRFTSVPAALVAFDEGPFGAIEGVFYSQRIAARNIKRHYPDAKNLPREIDEKIRTAPEDEITLLQCTTYDAVKSQWCFQVLLRDAKTQLVERYYRTNPWVIARWMKAPGETYGRGPLTMALPDIRTLNKLRELALISASFAVTPVFTVIDDGVINVDAVRITPNALIPVRSNGGPMGQSLKALDMPARFDISQMMEAELKTSIRQILFDSPLPPEVQVGLTATEVIERVREFQKDTGAFGRLEIDAVKPIVTRCLDILEVAGKFAAPEFKGVMEALQQDLIRTKTTSPLARAQDLADVQSVMQFTAGVLGLGEPGLEMAKAGIDPTKTGRWLAEKSGVPAKLIPDAKALSDEQNDNQENAQMMGLMQSPVIAQVAGQFAKAATTPPPTPEPM